MRPITEKRIVEQLNRLTELHTQIVGRLIRMEQRLNGIEARMDVIANRTVPMVNVPPGYHYVQIGDRSVVQPIPLDTAPHKPIMDVYIDERLRAALEEKRNDHTAANTPRRARPGRRSG